MLGTKLAQTSVTMGDSSPMNAFSSRYWSVHQRANKGVLVLFQCRTHQHNYPVCVCIAGLCICLRQFVYVCMYVCMYVTQKLTGLMFYTKKILLSVSYYLIVEFECLQSGFLCPVSCTDGAIRASRSAATLHVHVGMTRKQDGGYTQSTQLQREYLRWVKISFTHQ